MAPGIVWRPALSGARHFMSPVILWRPSLYGAMENSRSGVIVWRPSLHGAVAIIRGFCVLCVRCARHIAFRTISISSAHRNQQNASVTSVCPVRDKTITLLRALCETNRIHVTITVVGTTDM